MPVWVREVAKGYEWFPQVSKFSFPMNLPQFCLLILVLVLVVVLLLCSLNSSNCLYPVMEPSQMFGVSEECHSSESGWTMYIGSPAAADGSSDVDAGAPSDEDEDEEHKACYANNQDDSDDSMASDASSGPSHHQQRRHPFVGMKNPPHALPLFTHQNKPNSCLETKPKKPLMEKKKKKKQRAERKEVKEPKSSVQSSSKIRKSIWMGK